MIRRDLIETIAAVVLIFLFSGAVVSVDSFVAKIGAGFLVLYALFIIYKFHRTRTIQRPAPLDAPVREFCRIELGRLDLQIQLLRGVLWWYIAPAIIGANAVFAGEAGLGTASLVYCIVTLLLAWGIYALNMRAVAKHPEMPQMRCRDILVWQLTTGKQMLDLGFVAGARKLRFQCRFTL